jgi:hypothetical protein
MRFGRTTTSRLPRASEPNSRTPSAAPTVRPWRGISWPLSIAMFAVPAALALMTVLLPRFAGSPEITIQVADRYTGASIPGAEIALADEVKTTGPDGSATVLLNVESLPATVRYGGYEPVATTLTRDTPANWQIALRPNVLTGRIADAATGEGLAGIAVALVPPEGAELSSATDEQGVFSFGDVPEGAMLRVMSADHGVVEEPVGQRTAVELALEPTFVTGTVRNVDGAAVAGARVAATNGSAETFTADDGSFRLTGGTGVEAVKVTAAGYSDAELAVDGSREVAAVLDTEMIRAVYANLGVLAEPERWNRLIEIADTTEINAIVVDVKQDTIYYDTQVPFFRDIDGMVTPIFDPNQLLAELDEHGIYSIARVVVFKDPVVAAARSDLAVRDEVTGGPWLDMNGTPWVNAFNEELWEANADLGAELALLGFDEIQYDYIRFPSDGDLRTADFGNDYTEADRRAAITGAVALGGERVRAAGAHFAIDLFPIVALLGDDQGIGQTLQDLTPLADYVCLMVYPSHYEVGNIPVDGHPNDFPAETVAYTLEQSQEWVPGTMAKMRPWLQDFTYPLEGYSAYGPAEVRAQIDAAEALGVSGWLLWNAAGEFEVDALVPE